MTEVEFTEYNLLPCEAAGIFGVCRNTILAWAYKGRLKYVRTTGGHRRFSREQCEALANRD